MRLEQQGHVEHHKPLAVRRRSTDKLGPICEHERVHDRLELLKRFVSSHLGDCS